MHSFGNNSLERLATLHPDLQLILNEAIKIYNFSITEGHRTLEKQQEYFSKGKSKLDGVTKKSKHQSYPSMAVDIVPYAPGVNPYDEDELSRYYFMMGIMYSTACRLRADGKITHKLRFGMDWNGNHLYKDNTFNDLPHLELI